MIEYFTGYKIMYQAVKILEKIIKFYNDSPLTSSIAVFFILTIFFGAIYLTIDGVSAMDDHYFHYKYAELLKSNGSEVKNNFDWITFSRYGSDKEAFSTSLFHYISIPFTTFKNDITGLKIMDIFWGALTLSVIFYFFRISKIRLAPLYILLMLSSHLIFTWSFCGRNYLITLPIILFEIYFATKKNRKLLFSFALLHILLHRATFFLPLVLILIVESARFLESRKIYVKNFFTVVVATIVGMMFYPGFPGNILNLGKFLFSLHAGLITKKIPSNIEGNELLRESWSSFFDKADIFSFIFLIGLGVAIYFLVSTEKKNNRKLSQNNILLTSAATFSVLSLVGSILLSGRFVFYFYIGTVYLCALALQVSLKKRALTLTPIFKKYFVVSITVFLLFSIANKTMIFRERAREAEYEMFRESANWIEGRSAKGDVVFLDNWSLFPILFFFNDKNNYTMGLEPKELYDQDEELFWKWYNIRYNQYFCEEKKDCKDERSKELKKISSVEKRDEFERESAEKIVDMIKNDFKSDFIFSHDVKLNRILNKNKDLFKDYYTIFNKSEKSTFVRVFELK